MENIKSLAYHLLGKTRADVLSALLLQPGKSIHVRELARITGSSAGSLHRELRSLSALGLILRKEVGRQVHYQANTEASIFSELAGLLKKTSGVVDVLRKALEPIRAVVKLAFIHGSVAAGTERPGSDIDIMVLGEATFADVSLAFADAQTSLQREVNPTPLRVDDFFHKLQQEDGFAKAVAGGARIWLIGTEDDFAKLAANQ
jgi:predicted nucleotidyltransferase/DNA-binding HxlR family transcriptional regulator